MEISTAARTASTLIVSSRSHAVQFSLLALPREHPGCCPEYRSLRLASLHRQRRVGGPLRERRIVDRDVVVPEHREDERVATGGDAATAVGDHAAGAERAGVGEALAELV